MSRPPLPSTAIRPSHGLRWVGLAGLVAGLVLGFIQPREPGDTLLGITMDYATASPLLALTVEGRIVGP